jgi:hypothetical protein
VSSWLDWRCCAAIECTDRVAQSKPECAVWNAATSWVNTAQGPISSCANKDKALQANPVQPLAGRFLNHLNAPQALFVVD